MTYSFFVLGTGVFCGVLALICVYILSGLYASRSENMRGYNDKLKIYKLIVFAKLASVINKLPQGVYIGDLHVNNVLVDSDYEIHLIDIDGFSTENGETLSVPLPLPNIRQKYYNKLGEPIISRNSDIYCIYRMFIDWIGSGFNLLEGKYRKNYLSYLHKIEGGELLTHQLRRLYHRTENIVSSEDFLQIDVTRIFADNYPAQILMNKENTNANLQISLWERKTP